MLFSPTKVTVKCIGKNLDMTKSLYNEYNPEAQTYNISRYNEQT